MRALFLFAFCLVVTSSAWAQEVYVPPLNGFTAGQEAAARTRADLLDQAGRQIGLNDALRQRAAVAVPALPPGVVQGYPAQPVVGWPAPVGAGFAYGYDPWGYDPWQTWRVEIPPWAQVRQSIGQLEIQTSPTRWESRPIYTPDAVPHVGVIAPAAVPAVPAAVPVPRAVAPAAPIAPPSLGTREF